MLQRSSTVCVFCRFKLSPALRAEARHNPRSLARDSFQRCNAGLLIATAGASLNSLRRLHTDQSHQPVKSDAPDYFHQITSPERDEEDIEHDVDVENKASHIRSQLDPEAVARLARRTFGDRLPEGALRDEEYQVYERLFGAPLEWQPHHEENEFLDTENVEEEDDRDVLLKEGQDGELEEIEYAAEKTDELGVEEHSAGSADHNELVERDITAALGQPALDPTQVPTPSVEEEEEDDDDDLSMGGESARAHSYTIMSRAGTNPRTIEIPKDTVAGPISVILAETKNSHLDETAKKLFGGPGLPYATGTPRTSRVLPQKPIPLSAHQNRMQGIEADLFLTALVPGFYASAMSVFVELRRRLGTEWLESLIANTSTGGGPSILDAGAGGAGALAWRQVLKAEHERMKEKGILPEGLLQQDPTTSGKATVLTGSNELRHRASVLLQNTTFLPRLPDYYHLTPKSPHAAESADEGPQPQGRKQFDLIFAPHSLWSITEEWQRKQYIQNLWAMLNPDGGVLVLLEKGVPRGFEVIAAARQYMLDKLFANSSSSSSSSSSTADSQTPEEGTAAMGGKSRHAAPGAILAPCTTHARCPLYRYSGVSRQRKDYCHFSQRYLRPSFLQRLLGAKHRNNEDVKFSYVAVQKGRVPEELGRVVQRDEAGKEIIRERLMERDATERAYEGYDIDDSDLASSSAGDLQAQPLEQRAVTPEQQNEGLREQTAVSVAGNQNPPHPAPHPLSLPHLVLPPLKRPGHIMLDVCTPSGTFERWTVPRSYGKQAYRDARKSEWGDGWALGAKTREFRRVRVGMSMGTVSGDEDTGTSRGAETVKKKEDKFTGRLKARSRKRREKSEQRAREQELRNELAADEADTEGGGLRM